MLLRAWSHRAPARRWLEEDAPQALCRCPVDRSLETLHAAPQMRQSQTALQDSQKRPPTRRLGCECSSSFARNSQNMEASQTCARNKMHGQVGAPSRPDHYPLMKSNVTSTVAGGAGSRRKCAPRAWGRRGGARLAPGRRLAGGIRVTRQLTLSEAHHPGLAQGACNHEVLKAGDGCVASWKEAGGRPRGGGGCLATVTGSGGGGRTQAEDCGAAKDKERGVPGAFRGSWAP